MADVHQEGEGNPTLQTGTESVEELEKAIAELFPEGGSADEKEAFLAQINKLEGRNYKTVEDYAKTVAERNKAFSDAGRKKKEEEDSARKAAELSTPQSTGDKYAERMLKIEEPNSSYVLDELKQIAKDLKTDVFDAWEKTSWIRKEAEARADADKNRKKVSKPSNRTTGGGGSEVELSDADRALLARRPGLAERYQKEYGNK